MEPAPSAVLVVDDHPTNRLKLSLAVQNSGPCDRAGARRRRSSRAAARRPVRPRAAGHHDAGDGRLSGAAAHEGRPEAARDPGHRDLLLARGAGERRRLHRTRCRGLPAQDLRSAAAAGTGQFQPGEETAARCRRQADGIHSRDLRQIRPGQHRLRPGREQGQSGADPDRGLDRLFGYRGLHDHRGEHAGRADVPHAERIHAGGDRADHPARRGGQRLSRRRHPRPCSTSRCATPAMPTMRSRRRSKSWPPPARGCSPTCRSSPGSGSIPARSFPARWVPATG